MNLNPNLTLFLAMFRTKLHRNHQSLSYKRKRRKKVKLLWFLTVVENGRQILNSSHYSTPQRQVPPQPELPYQPQTVQPQTLSASDDSDVDGDNEPDIDFSENYNWIVRIMLDSLELLSEGIRSLLSSHFKHCCASGGQ